MDINGKKIQYYEGGIPQKDWSKLTEEDYPRTAKDMYENNIISFPCLCCAMKYYKFSHVREHMRLCHIRENIQLFLEKSRRKKTEIVRRQPLRKAAAKVMTFLDEPKGKFHEERSVASQPKTKPKRKSQKEVEPMTPRRKSPRKKLTSSQAENIPSVSKEKGDEKQEASAQETPKTRIRLENPLKAKIAARNLIKQETKSKKVDLSGLVANPRSLRQLNFSMDEDRKSPIQNYIERVANDAYVYKKLQERRRESQSSSTKQKESKIKNAFFSAGLSQMEESEEKVDKTEDSDRGEVDDYFSWLDEETELTNQGGLLKQ